MMTTSNSIAETIRNHFDFEVQKLRLNGPDNLRTPFFGLFRSDNGKCVGNAVRSTYVPHQTEHVASLAEAAQMAFGEECMVSCHWDQGHIISVAPSQEYRVRVYGTDSVWPRLISRCTYDGNALVNTLGMYRDRCRNLMLVQAVGSSIYSRIRHSSLMERKLDELADSFREILNSWEGSVNLARQMANRQVRLDEFVRSVYPIPEEATQRQLTNYENRVRAIFRRVQREINQEGRALGDNYLVSAWDAFNGVQGYIQHDSRRKGDVNQFQRALLSLEDNAVQRAFTVATAA